MSTNLAPLNNRLNFNEEEITAAEGNGKSYFASTILGVAFVCTRIMENGYVDRHPMVHTDGARFREIVQRYVQLLTNGEESVIAKNRVVEERKKLEELAIDMERQLKNDLKSKHFDFFGNWMKRYGFGTYSGTQSWGRKQEERARNMKKAADTMLEVGHDNYRFTVQEYVDLAEKYNNLVKKGYISEESSLAIATKNQVKNQLEKLQRSIMYNIKSNYPDNWKNVAMDAGFLKVRN